MNLSTTGNDLRTYTEDGFLHLRSVLNETEVIRLKQEIEAAIETLGKKKIAGDGRNWDEGDAFYDRVFTQKLNLWKINDEIRELTQNPKLGELLAKLSGAESLRVWHDQALIKEPHANPTAWHLDVPYWSFHAPNAISIWIALEDVTLRNGCLYFLRGSHRIATYDNVPLGENFGGLFDIYPSMRELDIVPVEMKAGDFSFHNGLTAHCAGPNISHGRRIALSCAYMPDGCTFNGQQNILSDGMMAELAIGDLLDNDDQNPRVGRSPQEVTS